MRHTSSLFGTSQRNKLNNTLEREPHIMSIKGRSDTQTKTHSNKEKVIPSKDKSSAVVAKQHINGQWATPSGAIPGESSQITGKSSHLASRNAPQARSSLPNISSNRHDMTTQGNSHARASYSNSSLNSSQSNSSLPMVVQISQESLRWEHTLDDSDEEAERIRVYKLNRRKRYIAACNVKYEDWLSSVSNTSLSTSSGSAHGSKRVPDADRSRSDSRNTRANMAASKKAVVNMFDEYSQLVLTHSQQNSSHRIMLKC